MGRCIGGQRHGSSEVLVLELCLSHWVQDLRAEVQTPQSITCCNNSSSGKFSTLAIIINTKTNPRHSSSAPHQSDFLTDPNSLIVSSSTPPTLSIKIKMPPKRIQVQPSTRRAPPPSNYFTAAWQTITSEENSSVVISLTMAAVSSLLSTPVIDAFATRKRSCNQERILRGR